MHYNLKWIAQIHEPTVGNSLLSKEPHDLDLPYNSWCTKLCALQVMWGVYAQITN